MSVDFQGIGTAFLQQYYPTFGRDRSQVAGAYRDNSLLTYQGKQLMGVGNIMTFFKDQVTFTSANYQPEDIDCHPSVSGGVLISVNGLVTPEGETRPLKFNDVFHLATDQNGGWYITNQMFRITGGGGA